jgi:DNA polymerase-3 subunit chi
VDLGQEQGRDREAGADADDFPARPGGESGAVTRIDFYVDADDRLRVACRLAAKAVSQKLRVLVYAPDGDTAAAVDKLMWTTPAIGFLPHVAAGHRLAAETPVVIARGAEDAPHDEVLVNLAAEWPPSFARFQRLVEIVTPDEDDKRAARERYRFYRDRGYEIRTHNLAAAAAD